MNFAKRFGARKIRRVLLIYPPVTFSVQSMKQSHLPLGLAYLAAAMRESCEVRVLDAAVEGYEHEEIVEESRLKSPAPFGSRKQARSHTFLRYGLSFAEIEKRIAEFQPDLVGISCIFSSQFRNTLEVAGRAKKVSPEIVTVIGGSHPTFLSEQILSAPNGEAIDVVVRGEGEFALRDLIEAIGQGRGPETVPGLAWREDGQYCESGKRPLIAELDRIPFPARDLFPLAQYHSHGLPMGIVYQQRPFMNLITSRGCTYRCAFCSSTNFWGNKYRTRSASNVLAEMEELVEKYGIREFKFFDDNLAANTGRAKEIFRGMVERKLKVSWNTPNGIHVANLDRELLELMKASGCYELTLAVESGDPGVLKDIIHKPTDLAQVQVAAKMIREAGLGSYGFFIIGFPGETRQQIQNTLEFAQRLDLDRISCFIANPLPGTELYEICIEKGYLDRSYSFDQTDYFEGRFNTPEWTYEELHALRRSWFWRYNLGLLLRHPVRFLRRYGAILSRPGLAWEILKRRVRT